MNAPNEELTEVKLRQDAISFLGWPASTFYFRIKQLGISSVKYRGKVAYRVSDLLRLRDEYGFNPEMYTLVP